MSVCLSVCLFKFKSFVLTRWLRVLVSKRPASGLSLFLPALFCSPQWELRPSVCPSVSRTGRMLSGVCLGASACVKWRGLIRKCVLCLTLFFLSCRSSRLLALLRCEPHRETKWAPLGNTCVKLFGSLAEVPSDAQSTIKTTLVGQISQMQM